MTKNPVVTELMQVLNISRAYASKIANGKRPLTDAHKESLRGEFGGYLMELTQQFGLTATLSDSQIVELIRQSSGLELTTLADVARLLTRVEVK